MEETKQIFDSATVKGDFILYRERPLVREGNTIIYGNMDDEYILSLIIMNEKEYKGKNVPDKVLVQIMKTDPSLSDVEKIVKQDLKNGLSEAFDIGIIWLERLLNN